MTLTTGMRRTVLPLLKPEQLGVGKRTGAKFLRDDQEWTTIAGALSDGDKGDVTVSGGGAVYTVDWEANPHAALLPGDDIQAAIDALGADGGVVTLGAGTFDLSDGLEFPTTKPCRLVGSGPDITIIDWAGMGATPDVDCVKVQYSRSAIEELTILGPAVAGDGRGIAVGNASHVVRDTRFRNVLVRNTSGEALAFLGTAELAPDYFCFLSVVENCVFRSNFQAGATSGGMVYIGSGCTTITFRNCSFDTFKGSAISIFPGIGGGGFLLDQCNIEQPADNANHWVVLSGAHWVTLRDCWFENTTAFIGKYKILTTGGCMGINILNCHHTTTTELTPLCINIGAASSGTHIDKGASIINFWVQIHDDDPVGATILQFGSAHETPENHVLAGGGIRRNVAGTYFAWGDGPYYTETAGALEVRDTA